MGEQDSIIDTTKTSKYNAGLMQMVRIDGLLKEAASSYTTPKAWNDEKKEWCFQILIRNLNLVLKEISGKLGLKEIKKGRELMDAIENGLVKFPLYELVNGKMQFNEPRWLIIKKYIEKYDFYLRELMDSHEFSSPSKLDPSKAVLNR